MPTVMLADDHPIVRQGLKALIEREPDLCIIAEAADGLETMNLVAQLKPDILVLDLMMPRITGFEVVRFVKKRAPKTKIIILSMYSEESYIVRLFQMGIPAYILKEAAPDELIAAIRKVLAGDYYLSTALAKYAPIMKKTPVIKGVDGLKRLSPRERQVLHLIAESHTDQKIAELLFIQPGTVRMHRSNLLRKLKMSSRAQLISYAVKHRIM